VATRWLEWRHNVRVITILSIQSTVAYGHAGNSAAVFPLQRSGIDVWPVITVHFSNNTSYGSWRGPLLAAADVLEVVRGIDDREQLGRVDAVLSGYQGDESMGAAILSALDLVRERNPKAIYCCDPVMGDVGRGFYVHAGIPEFMRDHVVPRAQIVTPNHFELDFLSGRETRTVADLCGAARDVLDMGPELVVVTSAVVEDTGPDTITMVAVTRDAAWQVTTPLIDRAFTGSGDVTTALFLANRLQGKDIGTSLANTADSVYSLLKVTADAGSRELLLVGAQEEIVKPSYHFEAIRLG